MKLAFLFPGQGSQYLGMGRKIYEDYPQAKKIFDQADSCLGINLSRLCFEGPEEELAKTVNAQPAILTVSIAYLQIINEFGIKPHGVAGHSLGEYSALVASGSLSFEDAVQLVRKRGLFMQEAVALGRGGMAAVMGLDVASVQDICKESSIKGVVEAVNLNSPGQVVIAGENEALDAACNLARERGAKRCIKLPVSAPFHSSLMRPAGKRLARELEKVTVDDPNVPVVVNVSAGYAESGEQIRRALTDQVHSPVRWQESIERMIADGFDTFFEIGPGKVLTGLTRKINRRVTTFSADSDEELESVLLRVKEVAK
jgi:[acyl-carrier-protein] S-malonyltransferase